MSRFCKLAPPRKPKNPPPLVGSVEILQRGLCAVSSECTTTTWLGLSRYACDLTSHPEQQLGSNPGIEGLAAGGRRLKGIFGHNADISSCINILSMYMYIVHIYTYRD